MRRSIKVLAAALGVALGLSAAANAQTLRRHAPRPAGEAGRQIVVHPRQSYLTAGPVAFVGTHDKYVLDTFAPIGQYMPNIDHTFAGQRGLELIPNNFTVPGCCVP
jgi:hypothetical protein